MPTRLVPPLRIALIAVMLGAAGCAALFGFDELQDAMRPDASVVDDAVDGAVTEGGAPDAIPPAPICRLLPGSNDAGLLAESSLRHFALRRLDFAKLPDGGAITSEFGLNLDNHVTTTLDDSPCRIGAEVRSRDDGRAALLLDDACGVDNMGATVFPLVESDPRDPLFTRTAAQAVQEGRAGAVLSITGIPANAGDTLFLSGRWTPVAGLAGGEGCSARGESSPEQPSGPVASDRWCRDARFLNEDDRSVLAGQGWLTDRTLVIELADLYLPNVDPLPEIGLMTYLHVRDVKLGARLEVDGEGHGVLRDGMIAGRLSTRDLYFQQAAHGTDTGCRLGASGRESLNNVCYARDLRGANDAGACDSISVAISFEAYEVENLGPARDVPASEYSCIELADAGPPDTPTTFDQDGPP